MNDTFVCKKSWQQAALVFHRYRRCLEPQWRTSLVTQTFLATVPPYLRGFPFSSNRYRWQLLRMSLQRFQSSSSMMAGNFPFFRIVGFLVVVLLPAVLQQIGGSGTVVDAVAHVGGIAQDTGDLAGIPFQVSTAVLASSCNQGLGHLPQPIAGGVLFKDHPHRFGLFLIDDVGVMDLIQIVAQNVAIAIECSLFSAHLNPGAHPLADFTTYQSIWLSSADTWASCSVETRP